MLQWTRVSKGSSDFWGNATLGGRLSHLLEGHNVTQVLPLEPPAAWEQRQEVVGNYLTYFSELVWLFNKERPINCECWGTGGCERGRDDSVRGGVGGAGGVEGGSGPPPVLTASLQTRRACAAAWAAASSPTARPAASTRSPSMGRPSSPSTSPPPPGSAAGPARTRWPPSPSGS